jgi:tetratricopeptide (TPR) repeat protein
VLLALDDVAGAKKALASVATLVGHSEPGSPEIVALRTLRARIALIEHRLDEARTNLDAALSSARSQSQILRALLLRSDLDLREGQVSSAEADARRALSIAQTLQGSLPYSNNTGLAWLALGEALAKQAEDAGAQQAFHTAVAQLSHTVDENHPALQRARGLERG